MRALVFVGASCNNRCVFCAQGDLRAGDLARESDDEVRARIAAARPAERVTFAGGEPTIREELPSWAEHAKGIGFAGVGVQTNGRRLSYRRYAEALARAGVDELDVALHGHEAAVHDWHVRVPGAFEQTKSGISHAAQSGMNVGTTTVVTRSNYRHLPEVVRLAASLGVDAVHLAAAMPQGAAQDAFDSVVPRLALLAEPLGEGLALARRLGIAAVVSGVPPCFLGDHAARAIRSADPIQAHGRACSACTWTSHCPGAPAEYIARRGDAELCARSDRPMEAALGDRFVGMGVVAPPHPERSPDRAPAADMEATALRALGKPAPGLHEIRVPKKKTGDELAEILPDLFEGG